MSALLFVCPTSGREISTGVDIDLGSFYQGLPRVLADIKCPDCGLTHNLFEVQSRLTDEPTGCSQCEATAPEPRNPVIATASSALLAKLPLRLDPSSLAGERLEAPAPMRGKGSACP